MKVPILTIVALAIAATARIAQGTGSGGQSRPASPMNEIAERYVKLVLALGQHDADYVDAYYGPPEWKQQAESRKAPLADLAAQAKRFSARSTRVPRPADEMERLRRHYLQRQVAAIAARIRMLNGERLSFDEESTRALRRGGADAARVALPEASSTSSTRSSPATDRCSPATKSFAAGFVIPRDKLDAVFQAAIKGCRERTLQHVKLPDSERFTVEYVTNKSWSGYNWYQGNFRSLIQVNTDLPIYIDRAVDLACHEGYPGHHVYNALLEQHLVRGRGWVEFSVYPLFSPQSLIAEGTANYGIEVAFPGTARIAFEKTVLFPGAGLDPARADEYLPRAGARRSARVCRQRGRSPLPRRKDRSCRRSRMARAVSR